MIKNRIVALTITVLTVLTFFAISASAESTFELSVNPYGGTGIGNSTIKWYEASPGNYYLFLPSDCDISSMTVLFSGGDSASINGKTVFDGEITDVFANASSFSVVCGNEEYSLTVLRSENLPAVYITTESGDLSYLRESKENKEPAVISIYVDGKCEMDCRKLKQIKGRGNSSWYPDKKPYNIKFETKTEVLGMKEAKKWSFLAAYYDPSFARDPLAVYLAEKLGLYYSSDYRHVDLYINNEYQGSYIIFESVEVGRDRVNISDLQKATENVNGKTDFDKLPRTSSEETLGTYPVKKWVDIPNDPENIEGGYLLELDFAYRYFEEVSGFITSKGQAVTIKSPESASKKQVDYISSLWQDVEDAIVSPDGINSKGKHYSEYFDMDSLVNMYILQEFSGNNDAGITSCFFYKEAGGLLTASPVWDFDNAFGLEYYRLGYSFNDPNVWTCNKLSYGGIDEPTIPGECPTIFNLLFRHEDFREKVRIRWAEVSERLKSQETLDFVQTLADKTAASAEMDVIRWNSEEVQNSHRDEAETIKSYIANRTVALTKGFGENAVYVTYDINGGSGWMLDYHIYEKGDTATVMGTLLDAAYVKPSSDEYEFAGWNTEANGRGDTYSEGDSVVLNDNITLYAKWKRRSILERIKEKTKGNMAEFKSSLLYPNHSN